jgi:hypothetical protein
MGKRPASDVQAQDRLAERSVLRLHLPTNQNIVRERKDPASGGGQVTIGGVSIDPFPEEAKL